MKMTTNKKISMKYPKIGIVIACICLTSSVLKAQNSDTVKYTLKSVSNNFSFPQLTINDPYLSPLEYKGIGFQFGHITDKYCSPKNTNISLHTRQNAIVGYTENATASAYTTYMAYNYGWGYYYHFRPVSNLQLLVGGIWDYEFGYKSNSRNVNNGTNIDLSSNINLALAAKYNIITSTRVLRVCVALETPLVGYMFVPLGGESYYEILMMGNFSNTSHISHPLNRQGYKETISFEFPLKKMTWRVGFSSQNIIYKANDMVFTNKVSGITLGASFDIAAFTGRVNTPPANFLNANN
jgi:Protein of unknown function (DUF3316)